MVLMLLAMSLLCVPVHAAADSFTLDSGHFSQNVNSGFAVFDFAGPGMTGRRRHRRGRHELPGSLQWREFD